jgi:cyclic pyranopterin phosphate synthase
MATKTIGPKLKKARNEPPILFITLDGICNNHCIGCSTPPRYSKKLISFDKIKKELLRGKEKKYKRVHFFGGEITMRKDVIDILKFAKENFSKVYITTNGRRFSDEGLTKAIKDINVDSINVSLHGHTKTLHQAWTQTPNSFNETMKGIRNLIDLGCSININHVLWKKNFLYLDKFLKFIYSLRISKCVVLNLNPIGAAKQRYRFLKVDFKNLLFLNNIALKWAKKMKELTFEDFPYCLFKPSVYQHPNIVILNTSGEVMISKEGLLSSYGCARAKERDINIFSNLTAASKMDKLIEAFSDYTYKNFCTNCKFINKCDGIFVDYFKENPKETIREVLMLRNLNKI